MKNILKLLLVFFPILVKSQTQAENYIKTVTYKTASAVKITAPTILQAAQTVTYFDGLGRPVQKIAGQQSATGKDIVTHIEYDSFGRQPEEYLPFKAETTGMAFDASAKTKLMSYYGTPNTSLNGNPALEATNYPFSRKELEASPLNRVLKQAAPGNDWRSGLGHEIKMDYQTNTANEVKNFTAVTAWNTSTGLYEISLGNAAGNVYYAPAQLSKTLTYDENTAAVPSEANGSTVEFKNKEGQVVLKRTYDAGVKHDTYYVYDLYGNLTYVIPPKADAAITAAVLNDLCYQYKYDYRNRLAEKKLPGKQWEFIVYDKLDRPVAAGPANSPFSDLTTAGWTVTKYDIINRPILTAWMPGTVTTADRKAWQDAQNAVTTNPSETKTAAATVMPPATGVSFRYSNLYWPTSGYHVLTVNYYDDYDYPNTPVIPATVETQPVYYNNTVKPKGLATGSWTRILETSTLYRNESSYTLYDAKARPVRAYTANHLGGYTYTDSKLDFSGKTEYSITRHKRLSTDAELTTKDVFTYSAQDRLLTQTHQINGGTVELIAANTYDELGQLVSKKVGNTAAAPAQKVDYTYNIRGWLTAVNDINTLSKTGDPKDLFAFKINYNNPTSGGTALYNGNISQTHWKTSASESVTRNYNYTYDKLNRLVNADFRNNTATAQNSSYFEKVQYDKNGNITFLHRSGDVVAQANLEWMDYMFYYYNGNQLTRIKEEGNNYFAFTTQIAQTNTADQYSYDANGNMTKDSNKNITAITYNHLNVPTKITFATAGNIVYIYNAAGQKVQKIVTVTSPASVTTTDYLGGYQYDNSSLKFFPTAEGYVEPVSGAYKYIYQYKDHLGNVRLSYDKTLAIKEESNFYPFGLKQEGYNTVKTGVENKYKYNGKELQDELGLNFYDYHARNYDPALGRWMNIDPHSESYYSLSPYSSFVNNPISYVDPTGEDILFWQMNEETGKFEQVAFNKLDKNVQKGIEAFGKTKLGYSFLSNFAKKGDKIGSLSFDKDGKYSKHNMYFTEVEGETGYEGSTPAPSFTGGRISFQMKLNKNTFGNLANDAETVGHEAFLHLNQYLDNLINAYKRGGNGDAMLTYLEYADSNPSGYKDHLSLKDDKGGRAKKFFDFVSQLKTVLNPAQVQKMVNKDINMSYAKGQENNPKKKK